MTTSTGRYQASMLRIVKSAAIAAVLTAAIFANPSAQAQAYGVLYSFAGGSDGSNPHAGLVADSSGNLFGTTTAGGTANLGTVFMLDTAGTETVLYNFLGGSDGATPNAGLIVDTAGNLLGTTTVGGASNLGTIFSLDRNNTETVLSSFSGGADGATPNAGLVLDPSGNIFGTTSAGGASNSGTIFELDTTGTRTVLYSFTGGTDGGSPQAGLVLDAAGNLYGTTTAGGSNAGLCAYGGPGCGVVFKLDTSNTETVLYMFNDSPAATYPEAGLVLDASGNFYGTATAGGSADEGAVFKLDTTGAETVFYSFTSGASGSVPKAGLIFDQYGNLYGTTTTGGASNLGTVFELDTTAAITVLHTFAGGSDGATPYAGLALDGSGNLYGTTSTGGTSNVGTIFEITPDFSLHAAGLAPGLVNPGASSTSSLNVKALAAFGGSVALTCSVKPSPALAPKCSISPASITAGTVATLTVSTTGTTAGTLSPISGPLYALWLPLIGVVTCAGFGSDKKKKERIPAVVLGFVLVAGLVFAIACGGGSNNGGGGSGGTPAGTYTITVTGTLVPLQHSTTTMLTVN